MMNISLFAYSSDYVTYTYYGNIYYLFCFIYHVHNQVYNGFFRMFINLGLNFHLTDYQKYILNYNSSK